MSCWIPLGFFGHVEIREIPPRVEGEDLVLRSRHLEFDGAGNVTRDEIFEGARVEGGAWHGNLFWP